MTTKTSYLIQDTITDCFWVSSNTWADLPEYGFECETLMDALNLINLIPSDCRVVVVHEDQEARPFIDCYEDGGHAL